jgi:chemotaxis protein methyltransferase CheR
MTTDAPDADPDRSARAVDGIAHLLSRRVGLRLDPAIRSRLERAVRDEAARHDQDMAGYLAQLDHDHDALQDLLNRVTVQETSFFRDPAQFEALQDTVLPALATSSRSVRVWSAGCAHGQEAYSMAMILAESGIGDWRVLATDISTKALQRAREGRYTERELSGLTDARRVRHLVHIDVADAEPTERGDLLEWEIAPPLRARVDVRRHNLAADPLPMSRGECHIVLCRNVLIYFERDDAVRLLERLADWMPDGASLLLGYSESLWQVSDRFDLERMGRAFVYRSRRADRPDAPRAATRSSPVPSATGEPTAPPAAAEPTAATTAPDAAELLAEGEAALGHDRPDLAIRSFRQAVYLDPDHPLAHFHLAVAFEAAGDADEAGRSYAAARAALARCHLPELESLLEGYDHKELVRLLEDRAQP